jgi:hypothetical protein
MQIAGEKCAVCGRRVGTMREGAACESCNIVLHKACVVGQACPKCGQSLLPTEQVHARPSARVQRRLDRPLSITVLGWLTLVAVPIGALVAIGGLAGTANDASDGTATFIGGLLIIFFSAAMGSGFLKGHDWARRVYIWTTPVAIMTNLIFAENQNPRLAFRSFIIGAVGYGTWLFFLTRPRAHAFFSAKREVRESHSD